MPWKTIDPDRAWSFDYAFDKKGEQFANSCAIKLREGELLVLSPALGVSEADFAEIEKHGRPVALVSTNGFHHLGLPEWNKRYPDAKLYASSAAAARISKKHASLPAFEPLSKLSAVCPDDVVIYDPPGMRIPDVMARFSTKNGWVWAFNDTVMNIPKLPSGVFGTLMKWTDSGPGFKVTRMFTKVAVKDKKSFKSWWLSELEKAPPSKIFTSHGQPILDAATAAKLPAMVQTAL